jgi:cation diffusion facilitator CzcD-associated flavoprotein CzcO
MLVVVYTEEEKKRFVEDPSVYMDYRRKIEAGLNQSQLVTFRGTEIQKQFWNLCQDSMKEKLKKKPEVFESICPQDKYPPGCRRLTPGPGYLEACVEDNVDVVTRGVARVVENGIYDDQGQFHEVDAIIYATGFN